MNEKTILITGASRGIGEGLTRYLSAQGAICVLVARDEERLHQISQELPARSFVISNDLSDIMSVEKIFDRLKQLEIKLDGMIHCAGVVEACPLRVKNIELWEQMIRVNSLSFVELLRNFVKKKISNDGSSVVAISSISSVRNDKGIAAYSATKAMLNSLIRTSTKEYDSARVRINGIMPGYVEGRNTEMARDMYEGYDERVLHEQPMGKIPVEQIAFLVEFLLSEKSKYITGALIPMEGGSVT